MPAGKFVRNHTDLAKGRRYDAAIMRSGPRAGQLSTHQETIMGKYFLAWILGVPATVLVLIYLLMH
jgi:hypothetical protein